MAARKSRPRRSRVTTRRQVDFASSQVAESRIQATPKLFADRIRELLVSSHLSQAGFAEWLDVPTSHVSRWLSGRAMPSFLTLARIAIRADCSVDWLIGFDVPRSRAAREFFDAEVALTSYDLDRLFRRYLVRRLAADREMWLDIGDRVRTFEGTDLTAEEIADGLLPIGGPPILLDEAYQFWREKVRDNPQWLWVMARNRVVTEFGEELGAQPSPETFLALARFYDAIRLARGDLNDEGAKSRARLHWAELLSLRDRSSPPVHERASTTRKQTKRKTTTR